jgi:hypothetical protein
VSLYEEKKDKKNRIVPLSLSTVPFLVSIVGLIASAPKDKTKAIIFNTVTIVLFLLFLNRHDTHNYKHLQLLVLLEPLPNLL